jgi:choline kinase
MYYKVLITTSGTGSRLGELTKKKNKSVIEIGNKIALEYIIESYPKDITLAFTIGYLGQQIIDFVNEKYPDRPVEFVNVAPYEGLGSSLGYSMMQAMDKMQCPFIFHACDTIVIEPIPAPMNNWVGGYIPPAEEIDQASMQYRTHKIIGNKLLRVNDKGAMDFDSVHIGLTGIFDYENFWDSLKEILESDPLSTAWSDVHVIEKMLENGKSFELVPYTAWLDTGNPKALEKTIKYFSNK